jgi:PEP-CTERM motif
MRLLIPFAIAASAFATNAFADTLYSNNFDSASTAGFSGAGTTSIGIVDTGNPTYGSYLALASQGGDPSNGTATLTLNTQNYSSLTLTYDVYAINTVDGDGPFGSNTPANPDAFITSVTGGAVLEDYSFANFPGDTQNYPGAQGPATPGEPDQTGALAVNQFPADGFDDAIYAFTYTFAPTGDSTLINFLGQTNQSSGDESFGLDNVTVTGVANAPINSVPEPASWLLMIGGLGGIGLMLRRAKNRLGFKAAETFSA